LLSEDLFTFKGNSSIGGIVGIYPSLINFLD